MAKYVKCVEGDVGVHLTLGSCYRVFKQDRFGYLIENDNEVFEWFCADRFTEPYDLPASFTFSSQQEFEDAVMKVVLERLRVYNYIESPTGSGREEYLNIKDDL